MNIINLRLAFILVLGPQFIGAIASVQGGVENSAPNTLALQLQPGTTAPAGATGRAEFDNLRQIGPGPPTLTLQLSQLVPGLYQIWLETQDNQESILLSEIPIVDPEIIPSLTEGAIEKKDSGTEQVSVLVTRVQITLPPELLPVDSLRLLVTDLDGYILLFSTAKAE